MLAIARAPVESRQWAMPEAEILLQREGGRWRLGAIFDSPLP